MVLAATAAPACIEPTDGTDSSDATDSAGISDGKEDGIVAGTAMSWKRISTVKAVPTTPLMAGKYRVHLINLGLAGDEGSGPRQPADSNPGQIEADLIARQAANLKADIYQVAHHGSSTSNRTAFLDLVQPKIALLGAGPLPYSGVVLPEKTVTDATRHCRRTRSCGAPTSMTRRSRAAVVATGSATTIRARAAATTS